MKVMHVLAPVAFGGGEALLCELVRQRVDQLEELVVMVGGSDLLRMRLEELGVQSFVLGHRDVGSERAGKFGELRGAVPLMGAFRRLVAAERPDLVHAHGFPPSMMVASAASGRSGPARVYTHHYERRRPPAAERIVLSRTFGRFDALTTVAAHLSAAMNDFFLGLAHPFETLPVGVADAFFDAEPATHRRAGLGGDVQVAVCVGRLIESKNQQLLLRAMASLPDPLRHRLRLWVVGDGPLDGPLRQLAADLRLADQVDFLGAVPAGEMPGLLAAADFGVAPSLTEASSVAVAEMLAAGLPVVALDIPAMAETLGDTGILTSPDLLGPALAEMMVRGAASRDVVAARAVGLRMSVVKQQWTALYRRVTADPVHQLTGAVQ